MFFLLAFILGIMSTPLMANSTQKRFEISQCFDPIEIRLHEAAWWPAVTIRSKKWAKKSFRPLHKIVTLILSLHKKCSFQFQIPVDLDKFTEEILNGKLHLLCSVYIDAKVLKLTKSPFGSFWNSQYGG